MTKYKYAIFDMDGTLIDSMPYWHNLGKNYLLSQGVTPGPDLNQVIKDMTMKESAAYFQDYYKIHKSVQTIIDEVNHMIEKNYAEDIQLKQGVHTFLNKLKNNHVKMCIATTSSLYLAKMVCKRLGIYEYFSEIISSDEVGSGKDTPVIYDECTKRLGGKKEQTIVFEDAPYALRTVTKAGYDCAAVYDESQGRISDKITNKCIAYIDSYDNYNLQ